MLEFRFHGRGGQGVVFLGKLVARLYFQLGKHVKEFPKFGVERRGAPVEGYVRVDDQPIDINCQVYRPGAIVVMAERLLEGVDVTAGLSPGSPILVNSSSRPEAFADRLPGFRVATVDANAIALRHGLGTPLAPIANTTLFGAFARMMEVDPSGLEPAIRAQIKRAEVNLAAARDAYDEVSAPLLLPGEPIVRPARPLPFATLDDLPELGYSLGDARANRTGAWRSQKPLYRFKHAPCNHTCPAGNDIRGFVEALAKDDPARALDILLETTPLPGVCGRVCPHPCETACNRTFHDQAVSICALERYAADHGGEVTRTAAPATGKRIAIVGAGPAGLSAAWQLAQRGHQVVLMEAAARPGGMLILGIPEYRLPRDLLDREIGRILGLGVDLRTDTRLGRDVTLDALAAEYDAVLLAIGMQISTPLRAPGEELPGVEHGLEFLRRHNLGEPVTVGERVVVIGGGNTALDVAGVALRAARGLTRETNPGAGGAKRSATRKVTIVYRRTRAQMPAIDDEVVAAMAEGVELIELCAPVEVVAGPDGRVKGLVCERMTLGPPDKSGRPRPVPLPDSRHEIPCDQVVLAIGQWTDLEFAKELEVGEDKLTTNRDKVWMCGDASTWAGTVTAAIGSGRAAAAAIDAELGGAEVTPPETWAPRLDQVLGFDRVNPAYFPHSERAEPPRLPIEERLAGYAEVVGEIAGPVAEAERCFSCGTCNGCDNCFVYCPEPSITRADGVYAIDYDYCKGCGVCFEECPRGIIDMVED